MKSQFPGLLARATNIVVRPRTEWPVIASESTPTLKLYTGYVAPLAAIGPLASIIGMSLVGISIPFMGTIRTPIASSVMHAITSFVMALVGVFVLSLIINALAPKFDGESNRSQALKVAAYTYTPGWLAGVLLLLPALSFLAVIAAFYGVYLLHLGLPILMKAPKEKATAYTSVVVLCAIVLGIVVAAISGAMLGAQGMSLGLRGNAVEREAASEKAGAAAAGALLGGVVGQDESGKAAIGSAIGKMAEVGRQMEKQSAPATAAPLSSSEIAAATSAMGALGSALGGGKAVDPIDFRVLKEMLPEALPEMQRNNASGERTEMMGIQVSSAEAQYGSGANGRVHVKISDLGTLTALSGMAAALEPKVDKETDTGYEKTARYNSRQVHESYDRASQQGEMKVLLDGRFEVEVSGSGVKMETIKATLASIDLNRLEAMKAQGVKQQ
jgi:hypothetical protein